MTTLFLIFQLHFDPVTTTFWVMCFGLILTLGLAFSETARCFVFLTIPQFFTKKGRGVILAYCFILALSGPGTNTTTNMEILTESLLCSQEMAHNATQGLINLVRDPYSALGGALKAMVDAVKDAATRIMGGLRHLIDSIKAVVNAIKVVLNWLKGITSFCNSKVGSPSKKCRSAFDEAILDCMDRLGVFKWMCTVVDLGKTLCTLPKWTEDALCWLPNLMKENVLEPITNGLKEIGSAVKTFFDVSIRFDYELEASLTSSKSYRAVVSGMKVEIMAEVHWLLQYMDWVNLLASLFMGLALYKAVIYRHRFLNVDRHDNFYITKGLVKLDMRRRRVGQQSIFPLKYRESFTFVQPFSFVLVEAERKVLNRQLVFVGIATVKISCYVLIDYVFYLFLLLVQKYGAFHIDTRQLLGHGVTVSGDGFMAEMYKAILSALSPIGALLPVFDTSPCLPIPSKPNYYRYAMIYLLMFLCVVACVTEPYGMRLRHIICEVYYPDRKLPRVRWLYIHILSTRGNFIFYARRELRSMLTKGRTTYRVGMLDRLSHTVPCLRKIFSLLRVHRKNCFLCGLTGDSDYDESFVECPSCASVYCNPCFDEVGGRCVACMSPIEFGDISEESGSDTSQEENVKTRRKIELIMKRRRVGGFSFRTYDTSSESSDEEQKGKLEKRKVELDYESSKENGMEEDFSASKSEEWVQSDRQVDEQTDNARSKDRSDFSKAHTYKLHESDSNIESHTFPERWNGSDDKTSQIDTHNSSNDSGSSQEEGYIYYPGESNESEKKSHFAPHGHSNDTDSEYEESQNTPFEITLNESENESHTIPQITSSASYFFMTTQSTVEESSDEVPPQSQGTSLSPSKAEISFRIGASSTESDFDDTNDSDIEDLKKMSENANNMISERNVEINSAETEQIQIEIEKKPKWVEPLTEDEHSSGSGEEGEHSSKPFEVNSMIPGQSSKKVRRAFTLESKAPMTNSKQHLSSISTNRESQVIGDETTQRPLTFRKTQERSKNETFRTVPRLVQKRIISATMAERIQRLDTFYAKMPFPPLSNVYNIN